MHIQRELQKGSKLEEPMKNDNKLQITSSLLITSLNSRFMRDTAIFTAIMVCLF